MHFNSIVDCRTPHLSMTCLRNSIFFFQDFALLQLEMKFCSICFLQHSFHPAMSVIRLGSVTVLQLI